jgi:hypothetical protein
MSISLAVMVGKVNEISSATHVMPVRYFICIACNGKSILL